MPALTLPVGRPDQRNPQHAINDKIKDVVLALARRTFGNLPEPIRKTAEHSAAS